MTVEVLVIGLGLLASALFSSQFNRAGDLIIDSIWECGEAYSDARELQRIGDNAKIDEFLRLMDKASSCDTRTGAAAASTLAVFYCTLDDGARFETSLGAKYKQIVERSSRSTYVDQRLVYEACGGSLQ
jgi:hypothetical protein